MKTFKELKLKKILKSLLKDSLKKKIFLISFGIFFSTLAFAAALTVTWLSRHMGPKPTLQDLHVLMRIIEWRTNELDGAQDQKILLSVMMV